MALKAGMPPPCVKHGILSFLSDTSFQFRPWWTGIPRRAGHSDFDDRLVDRAIDQDYPVFLGILVAFEPQHPLEHLKSSAPPNKDGSLMHENLLRAALMGSEKVVKWYSSFLEDKPVKARELLSALPDLDCLLSNISVQTFANFIAAVHPAIKTYDGVLDFCSGSGQMQARDLCNFRKYVHLCQFVDWSFNTQRGLANAVDMSDAGIVTCIVDAILEFEVHFANIREEWVAAVKLCIRDRKEHCLMAMHPLHEAQRQVLANGSDTVLMGQVRLVLEEVVTESNEVLNQVRFVSSRDSPKCKWLNRHLGGLEEFREMFTSVQRREFALISPKACALAELGARRSS